MSVERLTLVGGVLGLAATASGTVTRTVAAGSAVVGVLCGLAAILFAIGAWRERRVVARFVEAGLTVDHRRTTERSVSRLARLSFEHTDRIVTGSELSSVARWEATSWFNMSAAIALEHGAYAVREAHLGRCGTTSRVLLNALWHVGIPARKLHISLDMEPFGGHTIVEYYDGGRWRVISPADGGFVWRRADGEVATAAEIGASQTILDQVQKVCPAFPYRFDVLHRVRWSKLAPRTAAAVRTVVGSDRFTSMSTPRLYDRPRALMAIVAASAALFFGALSLLLYGGSVT